MEKVKEKSKASQYAGYQRNGGLMTRKEWEADGRHDPGLPLPEAEQYRLYQEAGGIATLREWLAAGLYDPELSCLADDDDE